MKKFLLSISVIVVFAWYAMATMTSNQNISQSPVVIQGNANSNQNTNASAQTSLSASSGSSSSSNPPPEPSDTSSTPVQSENSTPVTVPSSNTTPAPVVTPTPVVTPPPALVSQGQYKDGSYTGSSADAYYGTVQVKAIISGGKINDVQFLSYPSDRNHSVMINNYAMPQLTSEAIQAQSANVNVVSGATDTSMAFQQSLGSALAQAIN